MMKPMYAAKWPELVEHPSVAVDKRRVVRQSVGKMEFTMILDPQMPRGEIEIQSSGPTFRIFNIKVPE